MECIEKLIKGPSAGCPISLRCNFVNADERASG